jgi:dipeptidase E
MRLFLASRFHNEDTRKKLNEYVGGFKGKNIAYIPTASNGENDWDYWRIKEDGAWKLVNTLGANIKPIILENYRNESVMKDLKGKDIIWFAGGMAGYLMYWIKRCKIDLHIKELLDDGALYFGTSAGAMVAGQTLQISNWRSVDGERGAEGIKPMGLVDFDIFPHFQDEYLPEIKKRYKGNKIYLLKDGEEIIVEDDKVTVIGEERIITG